MAWFNNRTHIRRQLFQRFLALACIIIFIPLTIAALLVLGLIPVYLPNQAVTITRSVDAPPFNVTYLLVNPSVRSSNEIDLNSVDLTKLARSFESGLGLKVRDVLIINRLFPDTVIGSNSKSRRKRLIQCDQDVGGMSGPAIIFDFNLTYPINGICQTQQCVSQAFANVNQQFKSVPSLLVDFNNVSRELRLCSMGVLPYNSEETSTSTTQQSTIPWKDSNVILNTTESSNLTLTDINLDINDCLKKLPITQEKVPPYRITYTSTLFFQDDHSLLVVGASKFETTIDTQGTTTQIIINGVMVYTNCQRTIDVSLPMVCHSSISA